MTATSPDVKERALRANQRYRLQRAYRLAIRNEEELRPPVPSTLLHYTSLDAFFKIVETRSLRASRAELSNDAAEMSVAAGIVRQVLSEEETTNQLPNRVIELVGELLDNEEIVSLVTCFTEPRAESDDDLLPADILSMWRAYASFGDGVAVHFDGERVKALASNAQGVLADCRLLKVIYRPEKQIDLARRAIRLAVPEIIEKMPDQSDGWTSWAAVAIAKELSSFAAMFKHPGFEEENEWRLVFNLDTLATETLAFTDTRGLKRGYHSLVVRENETKAKLREAEDEDDPKPLPEPLRGIEPADGLFAWEQTNYKEDFWIGDFWRDDLLLLPITGATVGPSNNQRSASISIGDWVARHGYGTFLSHKGDFELKASKIPFRSN